MDIHICPTCNKEKPRSQFRRYASLAQTRAWLKNPNAQRRLAYQGAECNECHRKTKRSISEIRPEELRKRLVKEGKSADYIEVAVSARKAQGRQRNAEGGRKGIKIREAPLYEAAVDAVNEFVAKVYSRRDYAQKTMRDQATVDFLGLALATARIARDSLKEKRRRVAHAPECWQELVSDDARHELHRAYKRMGGEMKDRFDWVLMGFEYQVTRPSNEAIAQIAQTWQHEKSTTPRPPPSDAPTSPLLESLLFPKRTTPLPDPNKLTPEQEAQMHRVLGTKPAPPPDLSWIDDLMK